MLQLLLILNPTADRGHAAELQSTLDKALQANISPDVAIDWKRTQYPRHATELAAQAADYDIVVAVGGDGTVHEVVNGLMQIAQADRPKLGIVPVGSGNDFLYNLGLPPGIEGAVRCILSGEPRTVDVGLITTPKGKQEYWDNTVGIGFSGAVNTATRRLTRLRGFMIYFVAVLRTIIVNLPRFGATMFLDDKPPVDERAAMISICNGPREGGGFPVGPNALMDDGLLTWVIMHEMTRLHVLRFLPVVMSASHLEYPKFFSEGTAEKIRIVTDHALDIHIDGEIFALPEDNIREVTVEVIPDAIEVMSV